MTSVHLDDATGRTDFQFTRVSSGCDCPIHRDSDPATAPLGLRFAERVQIGVIPQHVAGAIYEAHHSYMDDVPLTNLVHHGLSYQGQLMGAITWRHPLIRSLDLDETQYEGDKIVEAARICIGVDETLCVSFAHESEALVNAVSPLCSRLPFGRRSLRKGA